MPSRNLIFCSAFSKKEASESRLWLRLLGETSSEPDLTQTFRALYKESDELSRILATILRNSQNNATLQPLLFRSGFHA